MRSRFIAAFLIAILYTSPLFGEQGDQEVKVGDLVSVEMSGDLVQEYVRCCCGKPKAEEGLTMSFLAHVVQILDNKHVRIEDSMPMKNEDGKERLMTFSVTCDSKRIASRQVPKGTAVYDSPDQKRVALTTKVSNTQELKLTDLKGVKIRVWTLTKEVGG